MKWTHIISDPNYAGVFLTTRPLFDRDALLVEDYTMLTCSGLIYHNPQPFLEGKGGPPRGAFSADSTVVAL